MVSTATGQTTTTWTIDSAHSAIEFSVKHMMFTNAKGRFNEFSGTIVYDEADVTKSSVDVEIHAHSIDTRDEKRDAHLKSPDFFETEKYPTIHFKSTKIEPDRGDEFKVTGDLTLHGVTKPVVLEAEFTGRGKNPWGQEVIGFTATGKINRKEFGLNWSAPLESGGVLVGDDVKLTFEIEASAAA